MSVSLCVLCGADPGAIVGCPKLMMYESPDLVISDDHRLEKSKYGSYVHTHTYISYLGNLGVPTAVGRDGLHDSSRPRILVPGWPDLEHSTHGEQDIQWPWTAPGCLLRIIMLRIYTQ